MKNKFLKNSPKVLLATAELNPIAKVGGLADVLGSLPFALKELGCETRLIMPKYGCVDVKKYQLKKIVSLNIDFSGLKKTNLWQGVLAKGVKVYFIEQKEYFNNKEVYWGNNEERFLFFSLAVCEFLPFLKFKPRIIHCHDYHTALIPSILKQYRTEKKFKAQDDFKTVYTIHNLNYQGVSSLSLLDKIILPNKEKLSAIIAKQIPAAVINNQINFMVAGIISADKITTVSPTYAKEITTSQYGAGLEKLINKYKNKLSGILNGIDESLINPNKDQSLVLNYSPKTLIKKTINKLALQKEVGLKEDGKAPLIAMICRFTEQKGLELINEQMLKLNYKGKKEIESQFVFLGTGEEKYQKTLLNLAQKYPKRFNLQYKFDPQLAQRIYAASDIFLVPSRFEPCGLTQMFAMRYGSVPLVRETGGLKDTVNSKNGFSFHDFSTKQFLMTLEKALEVYLSNPKSWQKLQFQGMTQDFSWRKSAQAYLKLYKSFK